MHAVLVILVEDAGLLAIALHCAVKPGLPCTIGQPHGRCRVYGHALAHIDHVCHLGVSDTLDLPPRHVSGPGCGKRLPYTAATGFPREPARCRVDAHRRHLSALCPVFQRALLPHICNGLCRRHAFSAGAVIGLGIGDHAIFERLENRIISGAICRGPAIGDLGLILHPRQHIGAGFGRL